MFDRGTRVNRKNLLFAQVYVNKVDIRSTDHINAITSIGFVVKTIKPFYKWLCISHFHSNSLSQPQTS